MTKYELDIPDPSRHPLTDFPDDIKSLLHREMSKLRGAIPTEVILGSEIHGLALTDAFNSAAPNNRNIIPLITRHLPNGYERVGQVVMNDFTFDIEGEPVKAKAFGKIPGGSDLLYDRAVEDIIGLANVRLEAIGIAAIPQRPIR